MVALTFILQCSQSMTSTGGFRGYTDSASFHGAAPLHHTLLNACTKTGVTLQTLHPTRYDQGTIIAQTSAPGYDVPDGDNCTFDKLLSLQAKKGAEILLQGIRDRLFIPPFPHTSRQLPHVSLTRPAPKITPEDSRINWKVHTADDIIRMHRVIGPLWNMISSDIETSPVNSTPKRIIWMSQFRKTDQHMEQLPVGVPVSRPDTPDDTSVLIKTSDGCILSVQRAKLEGSIQQDAIPAMLKSGLFKRDDLDPQQHRSILF